MASTIQITVLACAACGKLESTEDPSDCIGVHIGRLLWCYPAGGEGMEDLWVCASCTGKKLQTLLKEISTNLEQATADEENLARHKTYLERQAWDGWYASTGSKARIHYYRAGRSLCRKVYATSLWGVITSEPTGGPCPKCSQRHEDLLQ